MQARLLLHFLFREAESVLHILISVFLIVAGRFEPGDELKSKHQPAGDSSFERVSRPETQIGVVTESGQVDRYTR